MEEQKQNELALTSFTDLIKALSWFENRKDDYFDPINRSVPEQYTNLYERLNTCANYIEDLIQTKAENMHHQEFGNPKDL